MSEDGRDRRLEADAHRALLAMLAGGATLVDVADLAASWAMQLTGAEGSSVTELIGDELHYVAVMGITEPLRGSRTPRNGGFTGAVITSGQTLVFDPDRVGEASRARAVRSGILSGVVSPILIDGEPAGSLAVASHRRKRFGPEEVRLVSELASFVGLGLARVRDRLRRAARRHDESVRELASQLGRALAAADEPAARARLAVDLERFARGGVVQAPWLRA